MIFFEYWVNKIYFFKVVILVIMVFLWDLLVDFYIDYVILERGVVIVVCICNLKMIYNIIG